MQKINEGIPALIMVRDIAPDEKNPFTTEQTVEMIEKYHAAKGHDVQVIIIPDMESVNFGRGVGYEINEFTPPENIGWISATGIRNYSLQRVIADDRARADLAKVFEFYVQSLTKDYQAHTTVGGFDVSSEEQNSEAALKVVVSSTLRGVTIVDHFEIPERRELLSLARLDYDAFKQNIEKAEAFQELPVQVREDIKERADALHEEMEEEANKLAEGRGFFSTDEDY